MNAMHALILASLVLPGVCTCSRAEWQSEAAAAHVDLFLARHCLDCHSGPDPKGGLDLSRRENALEGGKSGPVIEPGSPDESLLWERVESGEMPPKSTLGDAEKQAIRAWIAAGAPWGADPIDAFAVTTERRAGRDWWSLQPISRPNVPDVASEDRLRTPLDAFIMRTLESQGLRPRPEADRRTLLRRLSFDLTGLPPTPEEVNAFLRDPSPAAYERQVDRLLASPHYGVRWARYWLDLARYGESDGFEFDEFRPDAWRYRDWVVDAFNSDMPYNEFARLQIAGDVIEPSNASAIEATGFLVAGAYDVVGQGQISQAMKAVVRQDELEDRVSTLGQTFLGLTLHCARCHDHKFDPIRQVEYYRIAAALAATAPGRRDLTALDPEFRSLQSRLDDLAQRLAELERPGRVRLQNRTTAATGYCPEPVAAWDFHDGFDDGAGELDAVGHGEASLSADGLHLDGSGSYATTGSIPFAVTEKTLEAWVQLDGLDQAGGAAIGIQKADGSVFDAIVFAEREPGRWMSGSENYQRSESFRGEPETDAASHSVHLAISYGRDGTVAAYRDGVPYGKPYRVKALPTFEAGQAHMLFGLRHEPVAPKKLLAGKLLRARLYDRALSAAEIAASHAHAGPYFDAATISRNLPEVDRPAHRELLSEIARLRTDQKQRVRMGYVVAPRPPDPTHLLLRGNPAMRADAVTAGGVAAIIGPASDFGLAIEASDSDRRTRLAVFITDPLNPLFSRVAVNRLWQAHFGSGLLETPSDLGFNGGRPSHPELLDWLAGRLIDQGWSLKSIHRQIVCSAAYRQSSRPDPESMTRDEASRLLWRKPPVRLEAEMVRDAMLVVSGTLDTRLGGPGFRDHSIDKAIGTPATLYNAVDPGEPGLDRRTLYRTWPRGGRSAFLDAFDCPDPSTTTPRRAVTTTPLQSLSLMNNALVLYLADAFDRRVRREAGDEAGCQVELAFRLAYQRAPDEAERALCVAIVERHGLATLTRALFNSNEFLVVE
jgi:mono/diheme cytochrome c family protein